MTDKAIISEYTWRNKEMQKATYEGLQCFFLPDDLSFLFRKTQRKEIEVFHAISLAVIAETEKEFCQFVENLKKRNAILKIKETGDNFRFSKNTHTPSMVEYWKKARRNGAAKAGGDARSENAERNFWVAFSKIVDRWHLKETSKSLMKEAGIGHHDTVRVNLGYTRWEWRKLSDAKRERVLKGKINAKR